MFELEVLRMTETAKMPTRAHNKDLCYDFYADEDVTLLPGQSKLVSLGIRVVLPDGYGLVFEERSGHATRGIQIGAGVLDEPYRGPWKTCVRWFPADGGWDPEFLAEPIKKLDYTKDMLYIRRGDKIVQGRLVKTINAPIRELSPEEFNTDTDRGENGFNSTGNK